MDIIPQNMDSTQHTPLDTCNEIDEVVRSFIESETKEQESSSESVAIGCEADGKSLQKENEALKNELRVLRLLAELSEDTSTDCVPRTSMCIDPTKMLDTLSKWTPPVTWDCLGAVMAASMKYF